MEWIKCSERMPERDGRYLAFDGEIVTVDYNAAHEVWSIDGEGFNKNVFSHWMPLPEPPKE